MAIETLAEAYDAIDRFVSSHGRIPKYKELSFDYVREQGRRMHRHVIIGRAYRRVLQQVVMLEKATEVLKWLLNLHHGMSRGGQGGITSDEWQDALAKAKAVLEEVEAK